MKQGQFPAVVHCQPEWTRWIYNRWRNGWGLGLSLSWGDVNGDGIVDALISASRTTIILQVEAYLLFGHPGIGSTRFFL